MRGAGPQAGETRPPSRAAVGRARRLPARQRADGPGRPGRGYAPCSTGSCPRSAIRSPTWELLLFYWTEAGERSPLLIPAVTAQRGLPGPGPPRAAVRAARPARTCPTWRPTRPSRTSSSPPSCRASTRGRRPGRWPGRTSVTSTGEVANGSPAEGLDHSEGMSGGWTSRCPPKAEDTCARMWDFMREQVFPAEPVYERRAGAATTTTSTRRCMEELKAAARKRGLWNLFLPRAGRAVEPRVRRRSPRSPAGRPSIAPEAINCQAPGHRQHGDAHAVRHRRAEGSGGWSRCWRARSGPAFAMTEPDVASSDATQHPDLDRPRRRRLRHQRPQVVDQRRRRRALPDLHRHGQDRPRRRRRTASSR